MKNDSFEYKVLVNYLHLTNPWPNYRNDSISALLLTSSPLKAFLSISAPILHDDGYENVT